ncbi:MAG: ABC transporter ATP-binding protein [Tissierellia bacterium]|nr:ABC transporter ATP-binding protein [Tissierellia bacterium]
MSKLTVKDVWKIYDVKKHGWSRSHGQKIAVRDASLTIESNKIVAIVGESGSGKSTLAKMAACLEPVTKGLIMLDDVVVSKETSKNSTKVIVPQEFREKAQVIFQNPDTSLNPIVPIIKTVAEGVIKHLGKDGAVEIAEDTLIKCGISAKDFKKMPHEFSGGQKQRISIARALAISPQLVLCDEPTASLDVSVQSQILNLMLDLKEQNGLGYMFITHDISVAKAISDEIVVMYDGSIVEQGDTMDLFNNPKHPYTISLIESVCISHPKNRVERPLLPGVEAKELGGCAFRQRCPKVMEICKDEVPKLIWTQDRCVACHLFDN